jgi:alpha-amylase/alpha-mannosidase (GH57 family)
MLFFKFPELRDKKRMKNNRYLTIHGHFYQPPRENPWIEAIERQDGAAPYHDWNDRIASECYTPNAGSRILDNLGRIDDIVNNYQSISFNFGPTLLSWLELHAAEAYQAILDADRESVAKFSGHGNAIAQAYNHIILPLANQRDKITQIRWGLADFQHRFGRKSESIWLPETAVNYDTLAALADFSIKYIILSPFQANRVRRLNGNETEPWLDVSNGSINTSQPYRCFLIDNNGNKDNSKYIEIFFYHGGLSRAVGFEHILHDAKIFADAIEKTYTSDSDRNQLISVCTDGESYGHHEAFGDMALAYLMEVEAQKRGLAVTNYGEFLENNPPQWEVELKEGPNGEGTSWSCFHGVGRWYRDCGCHSGAGPGWNQKWRRPLRQAMDGLRDDLAQCYEAEGRKFFKDPWETRNDYIKVVLDRSLKNVDLFLEKHATNSSVSENKVPMLNLLEMQRNAMLMYTSCGWFFNDISGIETVQVLKYAARAIELTRSFGYNEMETKFLSKLREAKSNIPEFKDGAAIYKTLVKPSVVTFPKIVNHFAVLKSFKHNGSKRTLYHYTIDLLDQEDINIASQKFVIACVQVTSGITSENNRFVYLLNGTHEPVYSCYVKMLDDADEYQRIKSEVIQSGNESPERFQKTIEKIWNEAMFSIYDLLFDERTEVFGLLFQEKMNTLNQVYRKVYAENKALLKILKESGLPIPAVLKVPAETALSLEFLDELEKSKQDFDKLFYKKALAIVKKAGDFGFQLDLEIPEKRFNHILIERMQQVYQSPDIQNCTEILEILEMMGSLKIKVQEGILQNIIFKVLQEKLPKLIEDSAVKSKISDKYQLVTAIVQLSYRLNFSPSFYKQELFAIEKKLSDDPAYWP